MSDAKQDPLSSNRLDRDEVGCNNEHFVAVQADTNVIVQSDADQPEAIRLALGDGDLQIDQQSNKYAVWSQLTWLYCPLPFLSYTPTLLSMLTLRAQNGPAHFIRSINQQVIRRWRRPIVLQRFSCKSVHLLKAQKHQQRSPRPVVSHGRSAHPSRSIVPLVQRIDSQVDVIIRRRWSLENDCTHDTTSVLRRVMRMIPASAELRNVEGVCSRLTWCERAFCQAGHAV